MKLIKNGEYTLDEIAKILGITRERVRQIEAQALKKLRSPKVGKKLKEYMVDQIEVMNMIKCLQNLECPQ